jgi:hypothetical protein
LQPRPHDTINHLERNRPAHSSHALLPLSIQRLHLMAEGMCYSAGNSGDLGRGVAERITLWATFGQAKAEQTRKLPNSAN